MMLALLERALGDLRSTVRDLEPEKLATSDAATLFDLFTALERASVAGKTLLAPRASDSGVWRTKGHRSPASWVAEATGTSLGEAIGMLETAERLQSLPETTEALRRGELSAPQVREISAAAAENPATEGALLEAASKNGLKGLKDECRRVKARSAGESQARARYEEIRKNRFLLMWTDRDGAGRVEAKLAPDDMARFVGAIRGETNAVYEEARRAGRREPTIAYEADALVALVTGTSTRSSGPIARRARSTNAASTDSASPKSDSTESSTESDPTNGAVIGGRRGAIGRSRPPTTLMHLRVDLAALRRGKLAGGETCEIPGVGPVPLATAVNELGDALLKVIITDGVDVRGICHLGRAVPAHVRSALEDRDERCVVPGCEVAQGLEIDHYKIGFAQDGPTELWNLCRLCHWHHYLKTYCDYVLTGQPGSWKWKPPESESNPVLTS
jgi:hypothetical protein